MSRNKIFFFLIFIWFLLSLFRTLYNLSKVVTEDIDALITTDDAKRTNTFGEEYLVLQVIEMNTQKNSSVFLITSNELLGRGLYYKSLYFLYPRKISIIDFQKEVPKFNSNNSVFLILPSYQFDKAGLSRELKTIYNGSTVKSAQLKI